jgi:nicotinamidase/pyrazinamidase
VDEIIQLVNEWLAVARAGGIRVIVTRDWHPFDHVRFVERGGTQPAHCFWDTPGAAFHPDLRLPRDVVIVSKSTDPDVEPVSAFDGTDLVPRLRDLGARRLWIAGVPLDEIVRATTLVSRPGEL